SRARAPVLAGGRGLAQVDVVPPEHVVHLRAQPPAGRHVLDLVHAALHQASDTSVRRSSVCSRPILYPFSDRGAAPTVTAETAAAGTRISVRTSPGWIWLSFSGSFEGGMKNSPAGTVRGPFSPSSTKVPPKATSATAALEGCGA